MVPLIQQETPQAVAAADVRAAEPAWSATLDGSWTAPPDESGLMILVGAADRGPWHAELRWNYEDRDTLSAFFGRSFVHDGELSAAVTPLLGAVGGETDGVAAGLQLELAWRALSFTSDAEYVLGNGDFFYAWNELLWYPTDGLGLGLVAQRTRVFEQELSVDRGAMASLDLGNVWASAYFFNPDQEDPYVTLAVGFGF